MARDLTRGSITGGLLGFALPLICGNLLQQAYNLADTWIVGRYLGEAALAAVGSSYLLLTFLTSILLGLCLGSSTYLSIQFGRGDERRLRRGVFQSFVLIGGLTLLLNGGVYGGLESFLVLLHIPGAVEGLARAYLLWIFGGIAATFLYNYLASLLRAVGDSVTPLVFLGVSVVLNIALDVLFIAGLSLGVKGAALATVLAQYTAGLGLLVRVWRRYPQLRPRREDMVWERYSVASVVRLSLFTCLQQSVMNGGILLVQGLVNTFGPTVMAAFAVAVKIDTLAYMPVQDFGSAFATFVAQNYGAGKRDRIRAGVRSAVVCVVIFCLGMGGAVSLLAPRLLSFFLGPEAVAIGTGYLRIEGSLYLGIGILFLLYGYFRAVDRPGISVVLTVCSLGTRVVLAYGLAPVFGVTAIWAAIPIGWFFADAVGVLLWRREDRHHAVQMVQKEGG